MNPLPSTPSTRRLRVPPYGSILTKYRAHPAFASPFPSGVNDPGYIPSSIEMSTCRGSVVAGLAEPGEIPNRSEICVPYFKRHSRNSRGMALVLVLGVLVLVSALVISFFSSVNSELVTSQSYANSASVRQLANSAVELATAQIIDSTKGLTDPTDPNSARLAWASQPGMIRTYDDSGKPYKYYKLYSSDLMIVDGAGFTASGEVPPSDWNATTKAGLYVDLNSPVTSKGIVNFPIIDPRAKATSTTSSVEGFDYSSSVSGVVLPTGNPDNQRLPMPVRWLYVLQNGKLATPTSSSNGKVSFDPANAPTTQNPIVGRIAFWTDDETCKINLNTASEGTFWDRPWAHSATEEKYSSSIPAQNEFQRYPGHPAKTSLSPVFKPILPSPNPSPAWIGNQTTNQNQLKAYYDLIPRIGDGGTKGGTINEITSTGSSNSAFGPVTADADRLFVSVDELLYSTTLSGGVRQTNANQTGASIDNKFLEKAKFFLTTQSRAPEVNLFGKPRMALWPIQMSTTLRNAKDTLIAFCSTINGFPYYFQRQSAYTNFGSLSSSQSPTLDWTGVPRNQALYDYLDTLTQKSIPGFGGSFSSKYTGTRLQILTEMFDMIRSGVNSNNIALTPNYSYTPKVGDPGEGQVVPLMPGNGTRGFGRFATVTEAAVLFYRSNTSAFSTPDTKAAPASISALIILAPFTAAPGLPPWSPNVHYVITGLDAFKVKRKIDSSYTPIGFPASADNWITSRVGFSGSQNNTAGNAAAFMGLKANFRYNADTGMDNAGTDSTKTTGYTNPKTQYPFFSDPTKAFATDPSDTTFDFSGGPITIYIYAGYSNTPTALVQTIHMDFPEVKNLPIPTTDPGRADYQIGARWGAGSGPSQYMSKDFRYQVTMGGYPTYATKDVIRSVGPKPDGPAKGDLRIYAALAEVPSSYFTASPDYDSGTDPQTTWSAHTLRDDAYAGFTTASGQFGYDKSQGGRGNTIDPNRHEMSTDALAGYLVEQKYLGKGSVSGLQEYRLGFNPAVPFGLTGAFQNSGAPGDWDNMTGLTEDGPYINKPDEGNSDTVSNLKDTAGDFQTAAGVQIMAGGYFSRGLNRTTGYDYEATTGVTFSPNRQVASAVMFGSLPSGINQASPLPWQTLLFCPNPAAGTNHPGYGSPASGPPFSTPPDWLLLDLFTMPIVEPYAISEPLSTAGKINMNYQIMPFTYIKRDTGVRGVLKSTLLTAIPSVASTQTAANVYAYKDSKPYPYEFRYAINPDESTGTLAGFESRFNKNDLFRSAAEICSIYLVPQLISGLTYQPGVSAPTSYSTTDTWWTSGGPSGLGFRITGDNVREAPYGDLYPRLTTKSNTYTIHVRVQTLKKAINTPANQWVENQDLITGEYRGSSMIERYVDPNDPAMASTDFAKSTSPNVEGFYKIRTVSTKKFEP